MWCKWEDNIKIVLREVGRGRILHYFDSGYGQVMEACKCGNEILDFIKWGEFFD
jgi:hypothetical protein